MGVSRKTAILRLTGLAIAVFASACTILVDTSGLDTHPVVGDGGGADTGADGFTDAPESGAPPAADTGVDACSLQSIPPPLAPLPVGRWTLRGSAAEDTTGVTLTQAIAEQAGALWWNEVVDFDHFDVTAIIRIEGNGEIADGMTFAWVNGDAVPNVGETGAGLGVSGLTAYAVSIDTYSDPTANPFIAVLDGASTGSPLTTSDIGTASVLGRDHTLRVRLESGGIVTVWFDEALRISRYTIPGYLPYRGHWGFTAATGGKFAAQRVLRASYSNIALPCP